MLAVTPWFPRGGDGAGSFVEDQVRAIARDHEVAVAHLQAQHGGPSLTEEDGARWRVLRCSVAVPRVPGGLALRDLLGLLAAVRRLRTSGFSPQLVHAHVMSAGFASLPFARTLGIPLVVSEHFSGLALGGVRGRARMVASAAYRGADLVCPASRSLCAALEAIAPGARMQVVPNPVDTELFCPPAGGRPTAQSVPTALAVTSLVPVKGVDALIEAVGLLAARRDDFRVRVVGDGPRREQYAGLARAAGVADRIELLGRLPREEVAREMRAADFLVVPSRWETFSVATAEALCCGLPVLATEVGSLPELVDSSSGRLTEPQSPAALASGIDWMLASAAGFDRPAIARRAARLWGAQAVAGAWSEIYAELAAPR